MHTARRVVEITMPQPELEVGHSFLVRGNLITTSTLDEAGRFFFLETKTGRAVWSRRTAAR